MLSVQTETTFARRHFFKKNVDVLWLPQMLITSSPGIYALVKAGNFDRVDPSIYRNYPLGVEQGVVTPGLIRFDSKKILDIKRIIHDRNLRLAGLLHLLFVAIEHSFIQQMFPVIALGQKWTDPKGPVECPVLNGFNNERSIGTYLANDEVECHGDRFFLVLG